MKAVLSLLFSAALLASCQKKSCYVCYRELYTDGVYQKTEQIETKCGLTTKEYQAYRDKYPNTVKSQYIAGDYWYYKCEKK